MSNLLLFGAAVFCIIYALSGLPIHRKDTHAPDPHQGRIRVAVFGVGVALLLFWLSEKYAN